MPAGRNKNGFGFHLPWVENFQVCKEKIINSRHKTSGIRRLLLHNIGGWQRPCSSFLPTCHLSCAKIQPTSPSSTAPEPRGRFRTSCSRRLPPCRGQGIWKRASSPQWYDKAKSRLQTFWNETPMNQQRKNRSNEGRNREHSYNARKKLVRSYSYKDILHLLKYANVMMIKYWKERRRASGKEEEGKKTTSQLRKSQACAREWSGRSEAHFHAWDANFEQLSD